MTDAIAAFPRVRITFLPTPVVEMKKLGAALNGPRMFVKRDDCTGLGLGGNKTRKLEFLIGEALSEGSDCVITGGAMQSNHSRQTAAAAAAVGLECHLALGGEEPPYAEGNLLLDYLFGAVVHWCGDLRKGEKIPEIAESLRAQGRKPYTVPYGGSNAIGALGFVAAAIELNEQLAALAEKIDYIIIPSSSGGTQAGMTVGVDICNLQAEVIGIGIDEKEPGGPRYESELAQLANEVAEMLGGTADYTEEHFKIRNEYLGKGYGIVGDLERGAIRFAASHEAILLDPVYTGRAMGGLIDMVRNGEFSSGDTVLFWHTGGTPALFAYERELADTSQA